VHRTREGLPVSSRLPLNVKEHNRVANTISAIGIAILSAIASIIASIGIATCQAHLGLGIGALGMQLASLGMHIITLGAIISAIGIVTAVASLGAIIVMSAILGTIIDTMLGAIAIMGNFSP
jgi:hypothetical protein